MKTKIQKILKKDSIIYNFAKFIYNFFYNLRLSFFGYVFRIFPVKNNRIVILNYFGKGYGDSSKYIVEEFLDKKYNVEIIWMLNKHYMKKDSYLPSTIKKVRYKSLKSIFYMATAKVWIDNARKEFYPPKRKNQFYIQMWHSSLRLKKIEKDAADYLPESYINRAKKDSKLTNMMFAGCGFSYNTYSNSFWYDGPIMKTGTPRCDLFFNAEQKEKIKEKIYKMYNIELNKKIILYAPTFRKENLNSHENPDFDKILNDLDDKNYIFFLRYHPNTNIKYEGTENVINVTSYPDMQELISVCDILITDYSGCCFDAAIARKKCILYVPDLEKYLAKERSLYFTFDELPFPKTKSIKELVNCINKFDSNYDKKLDEFLNYIESYEDGKASERIADKIMEVINGKEI